MVPLCKLGHIHMVWMRCPTGLAPPTHSNSNKYLILAYLFIYLLTSGLIIYLPTFIYLFTYFLLTYFWLPIY